MPHFLFAKSDSAVFGKEKSSKLFSSFCFVKMHIHIVCMYIFLLYIHIYACTTKRQIDSEKKTCKTSINMHYMVLIMSDVKCLRCKFFCPVSATCKTSLFSGTGSKQAAGERKKVLFRLKSSPFYSWSHLQFYDGLVI